MTARIKAAAGRCQIQLSPQCEAPEVLLDCPPHFDAAPCCAPCGKAFRAKFELAAEAMTLRALPAPPEVGAVLIPMYGTSKSVGASPTAQPEDECSSCAEAIETRLTPCDECGALDEEEDV